MHTSRILIPAIATALLGGTITSLAQDTGRGGHPGTETQTDEHMMGGDMMGGKMMRMCHQMMMGGQMGAMTMPRLPPGNEKLEMQMRAEMMRKMAEVIDKYAGRIRQAEAAPQK